MDASRWRLETLIVVARVLNSADVRFLVPMWLADLSYHLYFPGFVPTILLFELADLPSEDARSSVWTGIFTN